MILDKIQSARSNAEKLFALLIDPDRNNDGSLIKTARMATEAKVDLLLVGSSILLENGTAHCVDILKKHCDLPVLLFPGNSMQVTPKADGILFLSLISGRNPDLLIGQQVLAAPLIKKSGIASVSTGYMLIDSGAPTAASYMSQTTPIPHDKNDIAAATAIAGELLGMQLIYMDAGSGASKSISPEMIKKVKGSVGIPLVIGGGIKSAEKVAELCAAGADVIVVGNSIEQEPELLFELVAASKKREKV